MHATCGFEEDVGCGFAVLDVLGGDEVIEEGEETGSAEARFYVGAAAIRGDGHGDLSVPRAGERCDGGDLAQFMETLLEEAGVLAEDGDAVERRCRVAKGEGFGFAAFRGYTGEMTSRAMLPTFFERAKDLVLTPIKDRSGQSIHVDAYLGTPNSDARQAASHVFGRIFRRMRNATAAASSAQ